MAGTALKRLMAEYKRESRGVPGGSGHSSPPSSPPRQGVPPPRHRAGRAGPPRAQRRARPGSASPGLSSSAALRKPRTGRVGGGGGTVLLFIFIYFLLLTWSCLVKNRTGCGSQTKCGVSAAGGPPEGAGSLLLLLFLFIFLLLLLFLLLFLLLLLLLGAPGMGPSRGAPPSTSSPLPSALARCLKVSFSSQPRSFLLRPFGLWYPGLLHKERKWNRVKKKRPGW